MQLVRGEVGVGTETPSQQLHVTSGIAVGGLVDSVDISAHTHGAGAGDAPNIISASIAALAVGTPHIANQAILSALVGANVLATPHFADQGILSASLGSGVFATPHIRKQGVLSASIGTNVLGTPHIRNQGILSASVGANVLATPHIQNQGILSASIASGALGRSHISAAGILSAHIASGVLGAAHIASGVLTKEVFWPALVSGTGMQWSATYGYLPTVQMGEYALMKGQVPRDFNSYASFDLLFLGGAVDTGWSIAGHAIWTSGVMFVGSSLTIVSAGLSGLLQTRLLSAAISANMVVTIRALHVSTAAGAEVYGATLRYN